MLQPPADPAHVEHMNLLLHKPISADNMLIQFCCTSYFRTTKGVILTWFLPFTPGVVVYLLLHSIQYCCIIFFIWRGPG